MRVLIAEDDSISRTILQRAVEKFGHECLVAADGREAWEMYQSCPEVDVVISDWMMPRMDGLELCARVRGLEREVYPFFLFLTALGDREHLLEGMEAGADDYLTKPLDHDELRMRLIAASRVVGLHRSLMDKQKKLEELNAELFTQSRRDPLTRLGNRLRLQEDLETFGAQAARYGHGYSALLCDVDHFKLYNDHYGHLAGDEILQRVSNSIMRTSRTGDTAYRYGGEEFLVLLPEQSLEGSRIAARRLHEAIEALQIPHEATDPPGIITVSVGLSRLSPEEDKTLESLLKEADEALYTAKQGGRNQVVVHEGTTG
ncbi:MAG: diguanylate cyclase [Rubrobacter sp.]|nr:diguanylate cyclase [Rubrobacter sp.]